MKKILEFTNKYGVIMCLCLTIVVMIQTCGLKGRTDNVKKDVKSLNITLDSINKSLTTTSNKIQKEIKLEGLKSEKRMIQSTDRKLLDVNRQSEIDKEIENLK